ncbi:MAG: hypothetical protein GY757_32320 [bacterium]|nr:hypothetical protein [bacterium]
MIKTTNLSLQKRIPEISDLDLHIPPGETYVLLSATNSPVEHLINIFMGLERDFEGSVQIDDMDMLASPEACLEQLTFLSGGGQWPSYLKVGDLLSFLKHTFNIPGEAFAELYVKSNIKSLLTKKINELDELQRRKLLFSICRLKKGKNFIIRDYVKGMSMAFTLDFKKKLRKMKKELCSILYLGDDVFFALEIGDRIGFMKKGKLLLELPGSKLKKMDLKELYYQFLVED